MIKELYYHCNDNKNILGKFIFKYIIIIIQIK